MTPEELEKFMTVPVAVNYLCHSQDMFIFQRSQACYTWICATCRKNTFIRAGTGSLWIEIDRQKTGSQCNIPLLDIPCQIIEKYRSERKGNKIFNMAFGSCIQIHLNRVAKLCGIEKRITYHQSRHNFGALITLSRVVPLETVSQMMGHKRFRTTRIYTKLTRQKINEDMKKASDRIGRKYKLPAQNTQNNNKNE